MNMNRQGKIHKLCRPHELRQVGHEIYLRDRSDKEGVRPTNVFYGFGANHQGISQSFL